jgi:glycosyltransferase involved in cell wall biosynthesis
MKILCFYIGYAPDFTDFNVKNTYGSEISLVNISKYFIQKYRVIVFGENILEDKIIDNVEYFNSNKIVSFQENNEVDIFIIFRQTSILIDYNIKAKKVFVWVQDIHLVSNYQNCFLPENSKFLLKNTQHKIDGIITLTKWHKRYFQYYYGIDPNKIFIIGNAINIDDFNYDIKKKKNKFIWTSHGGRGIDKMIEYFHDIRLKIPDAELYVYRDESAFPIQILNEMNNCEYIHYGGKLDNVSVIKEFLSSEYWFYPTFFEETYCISALEAQMSKCVCITTNLAALTETVSDRGILIREPIYSNEYKERCINEIVNLVNNKELQKDYIKRGYEWAKKQTWEERSKEWYELFEKVNKM